MKIKRHRVKLELDASTHRWLTAFAQANSNQPPLNAGKVTVAALLSQAAFCMADYAGRRPGSWEASVAEGLLLSSGFQTRLPWSQQEKIHKLEKNSVQLALKKSGLHDKQGKPWQRAGYTVSALKDPGFLESKGGNPS